MSGDGAPWQPDVTVAAVVVREARLLLVEEDVQGRRVLNQPAGHLEPGESLLEAVVRETREETGWDIEPGGVIGAYQWRAPESGRHYLRFAFFAQPLRLDAGRRLDEGIVGVHWLSPGELREAAARHRSPLVWRVVEDYLAGHRHPLHLVALLP
jgi:8-oxo-dGTP pyrophosphatase MutT (NUDIX family)